MKEYIEAIEKEINGITDKKRAEIVIDFFKRCREQAYTNETEIICVLLVSASEVKLKELEVKNG